MPNKRKILPDNGSLTGAIYHATGLLQQQLAHLMGIKQATLSRFENKERALPTEAMVRIAGIYSKVHQLPGTMAAKPDMAERHAMLEHANWCMQQCHPLRKKLLQMEETYRQAGKLLALLEHLVMANELDARQRRTVEELLYQANRKAKANGWLPQQQLGTRIQLLLHEAALYKELAGTGTD